MCISIIKCALYLLMIKCVYVRSTHSHCYYILVDEKTKLATKLPRTSTLDKNKICQLKSPRRRLWGNRSRSRRRRLSQSYKRKTDKSPPTSPALPSPTLVRTNVAVYTEENKSFAPNGRRRSFSPRLVLRR